MDQEKGSGGRVIKALFAAFLETIAKIAKQLIREDKKASDAETEKELRDRWDDHLRNRMRDD